MDTLRPRRRRPFVLPHLSGAVLMALAAFPPGSRRDRQLVGEQITPKAYQGPRVGRNDPCPCKSGKKYKRCCAP